MSAEPRAAATWCSPPTPSAAPTSQATATSSLPKPKRPARRAPRSARSLRADGCTLEEEDVEFDVHGRVKPQHMLSLDAFQELYEQS